MKLPWDKGYLKISFHVIFTVLMIYIVGLVVTNIKDVFLSVSAFFGRFIHVLSPLFVAVVFAYLFNPLVDRLQKVWDKCFVSKKKERKQSAFPKRTGGTALTYLLLLALLGIGVHLLVRKIGGNDIEYLIDTVNGFIDGLRDLIVRMEVQLAQWGVLQNIDGALSVWLDSTANQASQWIMTAANSLTKAGGFALDLVIGITVAFYLLMEKDRIVYYMKDVVLVFLPGRIGHLVNGFFHEVNTVFSNYIGGQVTDAVIMAALISISFSIAGIPYAVLIGLISGFSNLIPYFGAVVAFILSVMAGLLSGTPIKALYAAIIVLILQQIDSIVIVPRVVGRSVEIHPVLVLLSLSIFGSLFGILGMVVAVPITAIIKQIAYQIYAGQKEKEEPRF